MVQDSQTYLRNSDALGNTSGPDSGIVDRVMNLTAKASLMPDPKFDTVGSQAFSGLTGAFDGAMTNQQTSYQQFTGESLDTSITQVNITSLAHGQDANASLQSAGTLNGYSNKAQEQTAAALAKIEEKQEPIKQALEQSGGEPARNSFTPPPPSNIGTVTSVAASTVNPVLGGAMALADARRAMSNGNDKLNNEQECVVAEMAINLCIPPTDSNGVPIEGGKPVIENSYKPEALQALKQLPPQDLVAAIKDFCKPAEEHAEVKALRAKQCEIDAAVSVHDRHENVDLAVSDLAEKAGVDTADIDAGSVAVETAQQQLDAVKAANPVSDVGFVVYSDPPPMELIDQPNINNGFSINMTEDGLKLVEAAAAKALSEFNLQVPEHMKNPEASNDTTFSMRA